MPASSLLLLLLLLNKNPLYLSLLRCFLCVCVCVQLQALPLLFSSFSFDFTAAAQNKIFLVSRALRLSLCFSRFLCFTTRLCLCFSAVRASAAAAAAQTYAEQLGLRTLDKTQSAPDWRLSFSLQLNNNNTQTFCSRFNFSLFCAIPSIEFLQSRYLFSLVSLL